MAVIPSTMHRWFIVADLNNSGYKPFFYSRNEGRAQSQRPLWKHKIFHVKYTKHGYMYLDGVRISKTKTTPLNPPTHEIKAVEAFMDKLMQERWGSEVYPQRNNV